MLNAKHVTMPRGPKGEKRPADVVENAIHVMRIATGQIEESAARVEISAAAQLGRLGGEARAKSLTKKRLSEIARKAARNRWENKRSDK